MPSQRRVWDSSVVIGYLAGYPEMAEDCRLIIEQAERGELEILVSAMATIEVAYLAGSDDEDSELRIREFFSRNYIVPVTIDVRVASVARDLWTEGSAHHFSASLRTSSQIIFTTEFAPDS